MSMPKILRDLRDVKDESITATSATLSDGAVVLTTPVDVCTGSLVKFNAPCACSSVTAGIKIGDTSYELLDTNGSPVKSAWISGSLVSVVLDCSNNLAYVQGSNSGLTIAEVLASMPDSSSNWLVCYADGKFVAAHKTNPTIGAISYDGINWLKTTIPAIWSENSCLIYGDNEFVLVGYNVYYSSGSSPGTFVPSVSSYAISKDGIIWERKSTNITQDNGVIRVVLGAWKDIAYGNGTYVLTGYNSVNAFYWNTSGVGGGSTSIEGASKSNSNSVVYTNGKFFMTTRKDEDRKNYIYSSNDGSSWTELSMVGSGYSGYSVKLQLVDDRIVASTTGSSSFAYTTDGESWTTVDLGGIKESVLGGNGIYIVSDCKRTGSVSPSGVIINEELYTYHRSTDLETWDTINLGSNDKYTIVYEGGTFLAISKDGTVSTSTDAITWSTHKVFALLQNGVNVTSEVKSLLSPDLHVDSDGVLYIY